MKNVLRSIDMAFSMFSSIPMPMVEWRSENMKYMLCALPLVGAVIGAVLFLWNWLCGLLGIGQVLYAAGVTLIPLAVSGGIHLDGYCDTVDALSSHALPEKKREILKDPRAGAFAVIFAAAYLLLYAAAATELRIALSTAALLMLNHMLARSVGCLASVIFPTSASKGLLATFSDAAGKRSAIILTVWVVVCCAGLVVLSPIVGIVSAVVSVLCLFYIRHMSQKEFGGMSGDLAGFIISITELVLLISQILTEKVVFVCSL